MENAEHALSALLNNGPQIPLVGLGTAALQTAEDEIANAVLTAIQAGYRHFDTAALYASERPLHRALKEAFEGGLVNRADVCVTTKLWCSDMHPLWQQEKLREYCRRFNVHVTAWSPLGAAGQPWGTKGVIDNPVIQEIAHKHGKTPAQVALRWGIEQGVSVIPKSYNRDKTPPKYFYIRLAVGGG